FDGGGDSAGPRHGAPASRPARRRARGRRLAPDVPERPRHRGRVPSPEPDGPSLGERPLRVLGRTVAACGAARLASAGERPRHRSRRAGGRRGRTARGLSEGARRARAGAARPRRGFGSRGSLSPLLGAAGPAPGAFPDPMTPSGVRGGVEVGGTFTAFAGGAAGGRMSTLKVPPTPANPAGGVLNGLAAV